jgi:uncharacterized membrane protein
METANYTGTQNIFRLLLGLFLLSAGTGHLTFARIGFQAQVPDWVPLDKDLTVVLSGYVEIALGAAIALLKTYRVRMGIIAAIFFVLVFPGNISQYVNSRNALGMHTDSERLARLFFQPILIVWALWSSGAWKAIRQN